MPADRAATTASPMSAGRMPPTELHELGGIEALCPERDPGDPDVVLGLGIATLVGARVGLECDLGAVGQTEPAADPVDDRAERLRSSSDGVPPPR